MIPGDCLQAGFYQDIRVFHGEEIVVTGFMMTPDDTNRLTGEQVGVIAVELFETNDALISHTKVRLTSTDIPNVWRAFAMTNFIPPHAHHARVALKLDNKGASCVFRFDFLAVSPDSDWDEMPNWWEQRYYGGVTNADALADSDSDLLDELRRVHRMEPTRGKPTRTTMKCRINGNWTTVSTRSVRPITVAMKIWMVDEL